MLSKSEWADWVDHPVSLGLREYLAGEVKAVLNNLAKGSDNQALDLLGAKTIAARAQLRTLEAIMEVSLEQINDRIKDDHEGMD